MARFPSPKNEDRLLVPLEINSRRKGALFSRIKLPVREAYLVTMFRIRKATHPFPHAPSWQA
jgi:hypothetical protein